jgi:hypothetical protein
MEIHHGFGAHMKLGQGNKLVQCSGKRWSIRLTILMLLEKKYTELLWNKLEDYWHLSTHWHN